MSENTEISQTKEGVSKSEKITSTRINKISKIFVISLHTKCYINEYISISIRETFLINLSKYDKGFPTLSYERSNSVHGIIVEIAIAKMFIFV